MALKAFYDGSGNEQTGFLTLAGYVGIDSCWSDFESDWRAILVRHNAPVSNGGSPYFHMREAVHSRAGYKGWSEDRLRSLWLDLINLLGHTDRSALKGFSCTVDLHGHREASKKLLKIKPPEDICVDFSFGQALRMLRDEKERMELFFDKGETFASNLRKYWGTAGWSKYVSNITEIGDMRSSYGTQAADTLAWFANRYYSRGHNDKWGRWFFGLFITKHQVHLFFDEVELLNCLNQNGGYKPGAKTSGRSIEIPGAS